MSPGLSGVKGEGMMELEPSEPLLEVYEVVEEEDSNEGEEEEEDEDMVRVVWCPIILKWVWSWNGCGQVLES